MKFAEVFPFPSQSINPRNSEATGNIKPRAVLHTEPALRFGNYFCLAGWQNILPSERCVYRFRFPGMTDAVWPEFSFFAPLEGWKGPQGNAFDSATRGTRFLHLFWLMDGYKAAISQEAPVNLELFDQSSDSEKCVAVRASNTLRDWDVDFFYHLLDDIGDDLVWANRVVGEIVADLDPGDQAPFRVRACPPDASVATAGPAVVTPACVRNKLRQLHRESPREAHDLAWDYLRSHGADRRQAAAVITELFPQNVRWWLKSVLENDGLGGEQAAEAVCVVGSSAYAHRDTTLARFCFELAGHLHPESQSSAWNRGLAAMESGDLGAASAAFASLVRHYTHNSLSMRWPSLHGDPWPLRPFPTGCFKLPDGISAWPRISVVTPSLNQGDYIEETLLSVLNQGYPNLQYIVVDGESTDGTREILQRYQDRIDILIVEADKGQASAINKGLSLADGEILSWLNSDDLLGPGALHRVALEWLASGSEVLAGICADHDRRHVSIVNKPLVPGQEGFTVEQLSLIFERWFQGWFFRQPEVFFTKAVLQRVGLLDEGLHYAMDYDLWMRFARAGATLSLVDWPLAFFRKHDAQKTSAVLSAVREQSVVRDRYAAPSPDDDFLKGLLARLRRLANLRRVGVAEVGRPLNASTRAASREILGQLIGADTKFDTVAPEEADIIIETLDLHSQAAGSGPSRDGSVRIAWLQGEPADIHAAYDLARKVDLLFADDEDAFRFLQNPGSIFLGDLRKILARQPVPEPAPLASTA